MIRPAVVLVACGVAGGSATPAWSQFTAGRIVVSQVGDGVATTGDVPITLREFTTAGAPTGTEVALPAVDSLPNYAIKASFTDGTTGFLKRSVDGQYLSMVGIGTDVSTDTRTIARIDQAGSVNTTTRFDARGAIPRSAITTNGTDFWWSASTGSGSSGGLRYVALGSTTSGVTLAQGAAGSGSPNGSGEWPVPYNMRVIGIFGGQLYGTSAVAVGPSGATYNFRGVFNVGSGIPTTANQYGKIIVGGSSPAPASIDDPWEFFFANESTIYVADNDTNSTGGITAGVQKWTLANGSWTKTWTAAPPVGTTGLRGLTGLVTGNSVQLYGITAVSSGTNTLVALADTLDSTTASSFSTLATAAENYRFRGVALAPVPEPSTLATGVAVAAMVLFGGRRTIGRRRG